MRMNTGVFGRTRFSVLQILALILLLAFCLIISQGIGLESAVLLFEMIFLSLILVSQSVLFLVFIFGYMVDYQHIFTVETVIGPAGSQLLLPDLFIGSLLLLVVGRAVLARESLTVCCHAKGLFAFFYIVSLFSFLRGWPIYEGYAIGEARWVITSILYFLLPNIIVDEHHFERVLKVSFVAVLVISILSALSLLRLPILGHERAADEVGSDIVRFGYQSSTQILFVSFGVIFVLFYFAYRMVSKKLLGVTVLVLFLFAVLIAQTRSIFLGLPLSILLVSGLAGERRGRLYRYLVIGLAIAVVGVLFASLVLNQTLLDYIGRSAVVVISPEAQNNAWRLFAWEQTLDYISQSPLLGHPFGSYFGTLGFVDESGATYDKLGPHNDYLSITSKIGLIGLLLFLGIIVTFMIHAVRFMRTIRILKHKVYMLGILTCLLETCVYIGFNTELRYGAFIFIWILMGLGQSIVKFSDDQQRAHERGSDKRTGESVIKILA